MLASLTLSVEKKPWSSRTYFRSSAKIKVTEVLVVNPSSRAFSCSVSSPGKDHRIGFRVLVGRGFPGHGAYSTEHQRGLGAIVLKWRELVLNAWRTAKRSTIRLFVQESSEYEQKVEREICTKSRDIKHHRMSFTSEMDVSASVGHSRQDDTAEYCYSPFSSNTARFQPRIRTKHYTIDLFSHSVISLSRVGTHMPQKQVSCAERKSEGRPVLLATQSVK